mmetsp:Transcript_45309/g.142025  ORF Transcript_45309/g.142025 Transcript_45309/m.142025 type:complete len:512 (-) Transcript_45309:357-1892(-)
MLVLPVLGGKHLHREGRLKLLDDVRHHSGHDRRNVRRGVLDQAVHGLVGVHADVALERVLAVSGGDERLEERLEERGQAVGLAVARRALEGRAEVVDGDGAHLAYVRRGAPQELLEALHELRQRLRLDGEGVVHAHAPDGPRRRVLHERVLVRVLQQSDEHGRRALDVRPKPLRRHAIHDGSEGHDGGLARAPVLVLDVARDEGHDEVDDVVRDGAAHEPQARRARHGEVPSALVGVLVLLGEAVREQRHELVERLLGVIHAGAQLLLRRAVLLRILDGLVQDRLLLAERGPELHGLEGNLLGLGLDGRERELREHVHVRSEVLVVTLGDLRDALEGHHAHARLLALRRLADHLHDHVALVLPLEVGVGELHRVPQRRRRRKPHLVGPRVAHAADNHRQHLVRRGLRQILTVVGELLAHVAEGFEARDLHRVRECIPRDALLQLRHEVVPAAGRHLDGPELGRHLRARAPRQRRRRLQRVQRAELDLVLHLGVHPAPALQLLREQRRVVRR